jgi:hypothetical protein
LLFLLARKDNIVISISSSKIAAIWQPTIILPLFAVLPDNLAAQGNAVETGSHLPVALWFIGAGVLGVVLAYGILRNRTKSRAEKHVTDQATKDLYAKEDRKEKA